MINVKMDELYELPTHRHDTEFVYYDTTYVLQPEVSEGKTWLAIWDVLKTLNVHENMKSRKRRYSA